MTEVQPDRVCRVCRAPLDLVQLGRTPAQWQHTLAWVREHGIPDHNPVPVPLEEFTSIDGVCDFCSDHHPSVAFGWRDELVYQVINPSTGKVIEGHLSRTWAACEGCAKQLRQRNRLGLIARVARSFRSKQMLWNPAMERQLQSMYGALFLRPFVETPLVPETDPFGIKGIEAAWTAREKDA